MKSSDEYIIDLLSRYKSKGILVDTNLLLVYFVWMYDHRRTESLKRVKSKAFSIRDLELLSGIFKYFDKVVTTPNILTEVSNLSNELSEAERPIYYQVFASQVSLLHEEYVASLKVCSLEHFNRFHLTDSGIIDLVKGKYLVLTDDFKLSGYLRSSGIDYINFDHLRVSHS
jgi:rRNA-processing protein FCF1